MLQLTPEQEREASYLSQVAQGSLLQLLETDAPTKTLLANIAADVDALLRFIQPLMESRPSVLEQMVQDEDLRNSLRERLIHPSVNEFVKQVSDEDLKSAVALLTELQRGKRPAKKRILTSHDFFYRLSGFRVPEPQLGLPDTTKSR